MVINKLSLTHKSVKKTMHHNGKLGAKKLVLDAILTLSPYMGIPLCESQ
jgi:hypothetical protein